MEKGEVKAIGIVALTLVLFVGMAFANNYFGKKLLIENGYSQVQRIGSEGYIWVKSSESRPK